MKSFFFFLLFLFFSGCVQQHHAIEQDKLDALLHVLHPVDSISPDDTLFTDLDSLRPLLSHTKIILLGEQSHGDGAVFLAKARLIKFLHQKMGFDVLAMESGLFDCEVAGDGIARGIPVREALQHSVFDLWTGSRQFQPVIDYLRQTQHTGRPMIFSGFDMQITGSYGRDSLGKQFHQFLSAIQFDAGKGSLAARLIDTLIRTPKRFKRAPDSVRTSFRISLQSVHNDIERSSAPRKEWWLQISRNLGTLADFVWSVDWNKPDPAALNLRDKQMAENLLWLARVRYPGKKIIVWGASSHLSRHRQEIVNRKNADSAMIPMGDYLWNTMKDSIYTLGFTAYNGKPGIRGRNAWTLAEPSPGSIEDIISHSGYKFAWLDFRQLPLSHWLSDPAKARPFGYGTMLARWPAMMDGMFYIETMTPSTEIE